MTNQLQGPSDPSALLDTCLTGKSKSSECEVISAAGNSDMQTELLLGTGSRHHQQENTAKLLRHIQRTSDPATTASVPSTGGNSKSRVGVAVAVLWMGESVGGGQHGEGDWLVPPGQSYIEFILSVATLL